MNFLNNNNNTIKNNNINCDSLSSSASLVKDHSIMLYIVVVVIITIIIIIIIMIIKIPVTHVVVHYQQGTFDQHPWLKLERKRKTQQHVLHYRGPAEGWHRS